MKQSPEHHEPPCDAEPVFYLLAPDPRERAELRAHIESIGIKPVEFSAPETCLARLKTDRPGCVVTAVHLPQMTGLELQQKLLERHPSVSVILYTDELDIPSAVRAMKQGAVDVLTREMPRTRVVVALNDAARLAKQRHKQAKVVDSIHERLGQLTGRERTVLVEVLRGRANKQIARKLHLSVRTIEHHRRSMMAKLKANSLVDLLNMMATVHQAGLGPDVQHKGQPVVMTAEARLDWMAKLVLGREGDKVYDAG